MKVLVAGANGHTGRLVVRYLKEKRHEPLALIRDEKKQADTLKELGAAPVIGDLEKRCDRCCKTSRRCHLCSWFRLKNRCR
ncbi:hypothetical protein BsIDN1_36860 [Bacillus safensis]|uniref:NAD(P)-binding domain-containing protein n=1 Tax=Bacillus safensis TaxID=561879 RepID=A0A5S9MAY2_BACIA|nr:hypothetical protein BsIDN1_36860 [Bacillus safensis]